MGRYSLQVLSRRSFFFGCERATSGPRRNARFIFVEGILATFPILDFDFDTAKIHASLGARLAAEGIGIGAHDLIIAATCLHHDLELATLNTAEFTRIAGLQLAAVTAFSLGKNEEKPSEARLR